MVKLIAGVIIGAAISKIGWCTTAEAIVDLVNQIISMCQ